jgi:hypothetical protein
VRAAGQSLTRCCATPCSCGRPSNRCMGARHTAPHPRGGICDDGGEEGGGQESVVGAAASRRLASLLVAVDCWWCGGFACVFFMGERWVVAWLPSPLPVRQPCQVWPINRVQNLGPTYNTCGPPRWPPDSTFGTYCWRQAHGPGFYDDIFGGAVWFWFLSSSSSLGTHIISLLAGSYRPASVYTHPS